eukprot:799417-Pleurochrysis_carterae.AAC.1
MRLPLRNSESSSAAGSTASAGAATAGVLSLEGLASSNAASASSRGVSFQLPGWLVRAPPYTAHLPLRQSLVEQGDPAQLLSRKQWQIMVQSHKGSDQLITHPASVAD